MKLEATINAVHRVDLPLLRNRELDRNPKTFVWTKKTEDILERVTRARKALNKVPSA